MTLWLLILVFLCLCISLNFLGRYVKKRRGFSLKSLLLAVTAVALLLGAYPTISAWIQRRNAIQQLRWAYADVQQSSNLQHFQFIRHQDKAWIIARRKMQIWRHDGVVTGIGFSEPPQLHEQRKELWVTPPGKWISSVDEAIALVEPQFDTK